MAFTVAGIAAGEEGGEVVGQGNGGPRELLSPGVLAVPLPRVECQARHRWVPMKVAKQMCSHLPLL